MRQGLLRGVHSTYTNILLDYVDYIYQLTFYKMKLAALLGLGLLVNANGQQCSTLDVWTECGSNSNCIIGSNGMGGYNCVPASAGNCANLDTVGLCFYITQGQCGAVCGAGGGCNNHDTVPDCAGEP